MCLLILLHGVDPNYPVLVASNRDELRSRRTAPPGLFVGAQQRMLSPRDREAHGTWIAVSNLGMFAGLTNLAGGDSRPVQTTRGELPHLALDQSDLDSAVAAVVERVAAAEFSSFRLLLADATGVQLVRHLNGATEVLSVTDSVVVLSNEHDLGQLSIPGIEAVTMPGLDIDQRLESFIPLLLDEGSSSGHRILKRGGDYGTVASSLIAVPARPEEGLIWRYAAGEPDPRSYRNYSNLRRRLLP
jgi:hypothetical protein